MKTLDEYMKLPYRIEVVPDTHENGFAASCPELLGCVTCAEDIDELMKNIESAKRLWLEAAIEDGIDIPEPKTTDAYSGQFKLRIPKTLHKFLAEESKREGISMNQYCLYLLSKGIR